MNRREVLIGTVCMAIATRAVASSGDLSTPSRDEAYAGGWAIACDNPISERSQRVAVFALGKCGDAIAEIDRLALRLSTLAYFSGSMYGSNAEAFLGEIWNVDRARIVKVEDALALALRAATKCDRVVLLGNFSAPFASRILFKLAMVARDLHLPVVAIGGVPAPGVQGDVRTRRGWQCIDELLRIGCCVTTVPEVDFEVDQLGETKAPTAINPLQVNEGSPYCRALELCLNQIRFSAASFGSDLIASTFSSGRFVSLGWGYCANGDAMKATNMALKNAYALATNRRGRAATKVLLTSSSAEILSLLLVSTGIVSDAIGKAVPLYFAASGSSGLSDNALQVSVFC